MILKLKAVGIPADSLPVTDDSKLLVDDHLKWVANLKRIEEVEACERPNKKSRSQSEREIYYDPEAISKLCKNSLSCYTVG